MPELYWTQSDQAADFDRIRAADAEADPDTYRREVVAARAAVADLVRECIDGVTGD
ncbi:MAG TPA: hypothetical protein VLI66_04645 [Terrabacter sp.]|nr:hypothetical protein [Terrabacter sp.]